jgi:hypothetical protein
MYVLAATHTTLVRVRIIRYTTRIWMLLTMHELIFTDHILEKKKMTTNTLKAWIITIEHIIMWKFDCMTRNLSGHVLQKKPVSRIQHSSMKQFTSIMQCPLAHNTAIV